MVDVVRSEMMSRLTLRLPETLHTQLEERAKRENVSLNQYLVYALTRQVTSDYTVVAWSPEEVQQQREQFEALLQRLRVASPEEIADAMAERELVSPEPDLDPDLVQRLRHRINEARATNDPGSSEA
jgi:hypothetical protein